MERRDGVVSNQNHSLDGHNPAELSKKSGKKTFLKGKAGTLILKHGHYFLNMGQFHTVQKCCSDRPNAVSLGVEV